MSTKHTPTPWRVRYANNLTAIVTPDGEMQLSLHGVYDGLKPLSVDLQAWQSNAAFIVLACNSHADLVAAVADAYSHVALLGSGQTPPLSNAEMCARLGDALRHTLASRTFSNTIGG